MNKYILRVLFFLVPSCLFASSSISFAPPVGDYSVVFLANLFGVVDGVLSGTGSQIMGSMFAVFNAAVLALGGIIVMYTLMVSTMNTAHEGQMLGQKWSSIWIPVRATIGLALLIPKASGYCLMQVFVMWVVLQGVGAADAIWGAALSYLNRGGVLVQAQNINPAADLLTNKGVKVASVALNMLVGQVCMLGLETQLKNYRQAYINNPSGPCLNVAAGSDMDSFCKTPVPDFISTIDTVAQQKLTPAGALWSLPMPNIPSGFYSGFNGICGAFSWSSVAPSSNYTSLCSSDPSAGSATFDQTGSFGICQCNLAANSSNCCVAQAYAYCSPPWVCACYSSQNLGAPYPLVSSPVTSATLSTTQQQSRAIALQQMYNNLTNMAQTIVGNAPAFTSYDKSVAAAMPSPPPYQSSFESEPFGVPLNFNSNVCTTYPCVSWGLPAGSTGAALFSGTEFLNAINAYNGIMLPTLSYINQQVAVATNSRFIQPALSQGWMMAGAYFYNLLQAQGASTISPSASLTDETDNAMAYTWNSNNLVNPSLYSSLLNTIFLGSQNAVAVMSQIETLIDGYSSGSVLSAPVFSSWTNKTAVTETNASTVYGFVTNSLLLQLPGQPGSSSLTFANSPSFNLSNTPIYQLQPLSTDGCSVMSVNLPSSFSFDGDCLGRKLQAGFYNVFIAGFINGLLTLFTTIIAGIIDVFIFLPMRGMSVIFQNGLNVIATPGTNPIVGLAQMGIFYINFSGSLWMYLLMLAVGCSLIPIIGIFIFALLTMSLPLLIAWVGVMVSVGFTTAYYVPILPYTIFVFGAISWAMAVIEAMVAAPIVALGVTHPEGHDAFGKGEAAIMILVNVFLRPSMMIIGYISAIILSFVGVWMLNAGYQIAINPLQTSSNSSAITGAAFTSQQGGSIHIAADPSLNPAGVELASNTTYSGATPTYSDWAGMYAYFFSILTYTSLYLTIVQKSFTLISTLPDKVLRWIGGSPESSGQESAQWAGDVQKQHEGASKATSDAQGQMQKQMTSSAMQATKGAGKMAKKGGGKGHAEAS